LLRDPRGIVKEKGILQAAGKLGCGRGKPLITSCTMQ
jgi:hypothetical protein